LLFLGRDDKTLVCEEREIGIFTQNMLEKCKNTDFFIVSNTISHEDIEDEGDEMDFNQDIMEEENEDNDISYDQEKIDPNIRESISPVPCLIKQASMNFYSPDKAREPHRFQD